MALTLVTQSALRFSSEALGPFLAPGLRLGWPVAWRPSNLGLRRQGRAPEVRAARARATPRSTSHLSS